MKKKITTLIISFLLIFNTVSSSFANPLVLAPVSISYNSLMALMGIGVAFGVALPKTDEEYWDYTRSLREHLNLVDEKYLERLDKIVGEWKTNNNNKPDNEKDSLKIPFIPGLDDLFKNVGEDVSKEYSYSSTLLNPLPYLGRYDSLKDLDYSESISLLADKTKVVSFYDKDGKMRELSLYTSYSGSNKYLRYSYDNNSIRGDFFIGESALSYTVMSYYYNSNMPCIMGIAIKNKDGSTSSYKLGEVHLNKYDKPSISYVPSSPSINNDSIDIELPNINIPDIETLPNYQPSINPPFDVQPSIDTETPPGTDTDTPPGTDTDTPPGTDTDTNFPSFPSFGDSLDFSPLYLTNIADKFPFSLPWDLGRLIEKFDVDPVPPVFDVPILSETITLDLTEFSELASIIRFFVLIGFVLSLIFISTKLKG